MALTPQRRRQLKRQYRQATEGATPEETRDAWLTYLVALYKEGGELQIFLDIRNRARANGAKAGLEYLEGDIDARQLGRRLRERCIERYAIALNRYGLAEIDVETPVFREITRTILPEVLKMFEGVDVNDKTAVCIAMARGWHRLVQLIHREYDLPRPKALRRATGSESDAETNVLDSDDFEPEITIEERIYWEAIIG